MITVTYENFMAALALFTALCVAGGWLVKIIKGVKKPADNVMEMLDRDNKRLRKLEQEIDYLNDAVKLLIRGNFVVVGHMRTDNNTGELAKIEAEMKQFLIDN